MTLDEQNFDLHRLLDEVHNLFYLKAKDKHLQLLIESDDTVPRYIRADGNKLRQVLLNLLSNALKFTQEGGVSLHVNGIPPVNEILPASPFLKGKRKSKEEMDKEGMKSKEEMGDEYQIHFRVEDTGMGIAEAELSELFEAFGQTATGKASQQGTGLGLAISRQFVQLMGGDISVQSIVGKGTVFEFSLCVKKINKTDIADEQRPTRQVIAFEPNKPHYRIKDSEIFYLMHKHIGVRYIYEEPNELSMPQKPTEVITPINITAFPPKLLTDLKQAAASSDMKRIAQVIDDIRIHNVDLANALVILADEFRYEEIEALIGDEVRVLNLCLN